MKKLIPLLVACSLCGLAFGADDESRLNQAIKALDARAKTDADKKLVLSAVSQQTKIAERNFQSQMNTTHLNYGELLAANSIAEGSGKSLTSVVAMRTGGRGWAQISKELKIDPASIIDRVHAAAQSIDVAQGKTVKTGDKKAPTVGGFTDARRVSRLGPLTRRRVEQ
jgi:hypothetical protein